MKNLIFLTIAIATFSTANAQMIGRSSISCMAAFTSTEAGVVSHSISKMSLVAIATEEVTEVAVAQVTEVEEKSAVAFGTLNAYPNPAVNNINFSFELTEAGNVNVAVHNSMGQKVSDVYTSNYDGGKSTQQIDLSSYTSGVYFISLNFTSANGQSNTITKTIQVTK